MKKILVLSTLGMYYEGITSVIYNYSNALSCKDIEFHFIAYDDVSVDLKKKFQKIGVVHIMPDRKENVLKYVHELRTLLKDGFDVVHIHGNSGTMCIETVLAKLCGVNKIIIQNHSVTCNHPRMNIIMKKIAFVTSDKRLAVSKESGDWLYGKLSYTIMNNAIDLKNYAFNEIERINVRKIYNLTNEIVIGNVARFTSEKNHLFLVDFFSELVKIFPNAKLLLLGDGPKLDEIKVFVQNKKINEHVIFAGRVPNPELYYSAMDLFLFPSKYESLGLVLIEAQANGLKCIASSNLPKVTNCSGNVEYLSTNDNSIWLESVVNYLKQYESRFRKTHSVENQKYIADCGFDITTEAEKLKIIYGD